MRRASPRTERPPANSRPLILQQGHLEVRRASPQTETPPANSRPSSSARTSRHLQQGHRDSPGTERPANQRPSSYSKDIAIVLELRDHQPTHGPHPTARTSPNQQWRQKAGPNGSSPGRVGSWRSLASSRCTTLPQTSNCSVCSVSCGSSPTAHRLWFWCRFSEGWASPRRKSDSS